MTLERASLAYELANVRVAVIGDVMLDSYLDGHADRISREAPVPIVSVTSRRDMPGGAGNAAANVRSLGGQARLLGVVGHDEEASRLSASLEEIGVPADDLVSDQRQTLAKVRVSALGQHLVRWDTGSTDPGPPHLRKELIHRLPDVHAWADAIVISDYGYGVFAQDLIDALAALQQGQPKVVVVDAKDVRRYAALRPTAVKPNYDEARAMLGLPIAYADERPAQIEAASDQLFEMTSAACVAVTLDGDGCILLRRGEPAVRTYARPVSNDRAAGAGDTFAACLAMALARGREPSDAVQIAAAAAAVAVGKPLTATCEAGELAAYLSESKRVADIERLVERVALERGQGRRIVFTNGCFDILHPGHVTYLQRAKALGDVLVVAVNSDDSVRRIKGPGRPVNAINDRLEVLSALSCVDHVVAFDEDTPEELIRRLRPDVFAKGGDYAAETLPEADVVREVGGQIHILPFLPERSTTHIIERISERAGSPSTLAAQGSPRT